jgi:branched-chain amino acid transport system substrate-binding protein
MRNLLIGTALAAIAAAGLAAAPAEADEQYFPLQSYRTGPYAADGTGFFGGFIDYMNLINLRDGGVNGVKLTWSECETEYAVERGVECYERMKTLGKPGPAAWNPLSVGIAYAMIDKISVDKVPLITINHGRTDSTDGAVFPYVFPLVLNPWSEASAMTNYIATREGGLDKLKGKKIVVLHHGSPYGRETIPIFELLAKKYGFEVTEIEVAHPGNEQGAQWLQIRRIQPAWIILRGWGVMTPVAIKSAQKTGFPADHVIGNIWSNSEEDVIPAGGAAKGFLAITTHPAGTEFPVLKDIDKVVYGAGQGNMKDTKRVGSVIYNLGVVNGILNVAAVQIAQGKFGHRALTGEEVQWGFEHLDLDEKAVEKLGAGGLVEPIHVTCADHEGGGSIKIQQWDGTKWNVLTDWIAADRALLRPLIEQSALKYASENHVTPRACEE